MPSLIQSSKFKVQSWKKGFTLIELLIVISLMALIAVVGIPNFRKLVSDQEFDSVVDNLLQDVRLVRSNGSSGIRCSDKEGVDWTIKLQNTNYDIYSRCKDSSSNLSINYKIQSKSYHQSSGYRLTSITPCSGSVGQIRFNSKEIQYQCNSSVNNSDFTSILPSNGLIEITLQKTSNSSTKKILITGTGVISIQ